MNFLLNIGISPCPNDCYIFYALIHHRIDTQGMKFNVLMEDVEELNRRAWENPPDICKLSYAALLHLTHIYYLSSSGGALGNGCGPLLICKPPVKDIHSCRTVVLPGRWTTAHFLFSYLYPEYKGEKIFIRYDLIEPYLLSHPESSGVIIHESRFTFEKKGLVLIRDLGMAWETQTHCPVPLGGIGIRKGLPAEIARAIPRLIYNSIKYAENHPDEVMQFMKTHAREKSEEIIWNHVHTYVNSNSLTLSEKGKEAIRIMMKESRKDMEQMEILEAK